MDNALELEKSAREAAQARMAGGAEAAAAAAAAAREIWAGARARKAGSPASLLPAISRGAMNAVYLSQGDLAGAAIKLLRELPDPAATQDPMQTMSWIMEGLAAAAVLAGDATRSEIESRIDSELMGAGAVFRELCEKQAKRG